MPIIATPVIVIPVIVTPLAVRFFKRSAVISISLEGGFERGEKEEEEL